MNAEDAADHARVWLNLAGWYGERAKELQSWSKPAQQARVLQHLCIKVKDGYAELAKEKE